MYFTVKYIDWDSYEILCEADLTDGTKHISFRKPIGLKTKTLTVNPNCFIAIIMDYIFDEVGIERDKRVNFDMVSEEGKPLNIHNYPPDHSGLNIFDNRGLYFVGYHENGDLNLLINKHSAEYLHYMTSRSKSRPSNVRKVKSITSKTSQVPSKTNAAKRGNGSSRSMRLNSRRSLE